VSEAETHEVTAPLNRAQGPRVPAVVAPGLRRRKPASLHHRLLLHFRDQGGSSGLPTRVRGSIWLCRSPFALTRIFHGVASGSVGVTAATGAGAQCGRAENGSRDCGILVAEVVSLRCLPSATLAYLAWFAVLGWFETVAYTASMVGLRCGVNAAGAGTLAGRIRHSVRKIGRMCGCAAAAPFHRARALRR